MIGGINYACYFHHSNQKTITMKKHLLCTVFIIASVFALHAQGIVGTYKQDALNAPKNFLTNGKNIIVTKDPIKPNRYWISNLTSQKFYAIAAAGNGDRSTFNIPAQKTGDFQINFGCIAYDDENGEIVLSLNNKVDCAGMAVSVNESLNAASKGTSEILKGVQYVGKKLGRKSED